MALPKTIEPGLPPPVKHPHCSVCNVPMWRLYIDTRADRVEHLYECKVCGERTVVPVNTA